MTTRPPRPPDVMTSDELDLLEADVKDTVFQVRCSVTEKQRWTDAAGGSKSLSAWIRRVLNRATMPDPSPADVPDTRLRVGGLRIEYDNDERGEDK